ncbi:uracil-DNA glycosylase family protein [Salinarchaeum chitinilyticum]
MQNVTDRTSNPFGMSPPCEQQCSPGVEAVYGYGDANADIHVVGDHPGVHGGSETGVPFTGIEAGLAVQDVLDAVDLLESPGDEPTLESTFLSYLHMCCPAAGETPSPAAYADLERFFDAELRAIAAHVLIPVGERATAHVLRHYTAESLADLSTNGTAESVGFEEEAEATPLDMERLHATEIKGSGWLVFPIRDPGDWVAGDRDAAIEGLSELLARDYRQISDLGRFLATDDSYLVR